MVMPSRLAFLSLIPKVSPLQKAAGLVSAAAPPLHSRCPNASSCLCRNFGYSTSDRDGRSVMLLDTRDPKHGRSSLRVTVPTATPLLFPFSTSFADAGQGPRIKPAAQYNVSFWARGATRTGSLRVELLQCSGGVTTAEDRCTTPAVVSAVLAEDWRQVSVVEMDMTASAPNVYVRATGAGTLWLDHVQVSGC